MTVQENLNLVKGQDNIFFRCVEDSNDAIMITNTDGVLVYVNRSWQRIYGYTLEEAVGQTPKILRAGNQDAKFYKEMWTQIADPKIGFWKGELVNRTKAGNDVEVMLSITPFRNEKGETLGYMSIALDMTEKKRLQMQVIHQDRLASVGLLASGLAHEIGTPLGVIRGRAEYLMMINQEEKLKKGLDIIVSQIDRISKLIYALLHLARPEKSETVTPISILHCIEDVASLVQQKIKDNCIEWKVNIDAKALVLAERERLQQVFLNLVVNSIHAIEANGKETNRIQINAIETNGEWQVSVEDTGCGISDANKENLFKPFFTTKAVGVGTGLGLVISYQMIRAWGGSIDVESEEGRGSTFSVRLPKASLSPKNTRR